MYGTGTWPGVSDRVIQILHTAYVAMARIMLAKHVEAGEARISSARVLARLDMPSVEVLLHVSRLSYLASFVSLDITCLWALAHSEGGWLEHVVASVTWLWSEVDGGRHHPSWQAAWDSWRRSVVCRRRWWKRLLRFAKESACRRERVAEAWQYYRGLLVRRLMAHGASLPDVPESNRLPVEVCAPCRKCFGSVQAWSVHAFKVHGRVRPERALVDGLSCPICLRTFASNIRLCKHVQHSLSCKKSLIAGGYSAEVGPGIGNKKACRAEDCLAPAMQGLGPLAADCGSGVAPADQAWPEACEETVRLLHLLVEREEASCSLGDVLASVRGVLCSRCLSSVGMVDTVQPWRAQLSARHAESWSIRWGALVHRCADWVCDNVSVAWVAPHAIVDTPLSILTFAHSEAALAWLDFAWVEPKQLQCPVGHGFLLCHDDKRHAFAACQEAWSVHCSVIHALSDSAWQVQGRCAVEQCPRSLTCLCLLGLPWQHMHVAPPVKAKAARQALNLIALLKDVVARCLFLWERECPFVAVLPSADQTFLQAIHSLPGIGWFRSEAWQVVHNTPEEEIPEVLFHII